MLGLNVRLHIIFRTKGLFGSQEKDKREKRRPPHRHPTVTKPTESLKHSSVSDRPWHGNDFLNIYKPNRRRKTIEEIKREYNQPGCQFFQIYHPHTQRHIQVQPQKHTIDVVDDSRGNSSKFKYYYF